MQDLNEEAVLPFPEASFDAVVCSSAIQYFTNPEKVRQKLSILEYENIHFRICSSAIQYITNPEKVSALPA